MLGNGTYDRVSCKWEVALMMGFPVHRKWEMELTIRGIPVWVHVSVLSLINCSMYHVQSTGGN